MTTGSHPLLRVQRGDGAVSSVELFFDLVYVFAVTQISHYLVDNLTVLGAVQTATLWFAVWLGWQYTAWVTNWFNPAHMAIRLMLLAVMGLALLMAAAIPGAFDSLGLAFAGLYVTIQVGRTLFVLCSLGRDHVLTPNFQRMLFWLVVSGALWIAGGMLGGMARLGLWIGAVACEYISPMAGFWTPGLGRSRTSDWTIHGGHLAERCQLFVIIALGESVLAIGATFARTPNPGLEVWLAFVVCFSGCLAMWWLYFDTSSRDATHVIERADDPGRMGANFHYVHVLLIAGVIVSAVAHDLVVGHAHEAAQVKYALVLTGGPLLYLLGNGAFKRCVYGRFPISHGIGVAALLLLLPLMPAMRILHAGALTTIVLILVTLAKSPSRGSSSPATVRVG